MIRFMQKFIGRLMHMTNKNSVQFKPRLLILSALTLVLIAVSGCGTIGNSSDGGSSSRSEPDVAFRTIREPSEIFPLTFYTEEELLEYATESYAFYRRLVANPLRENSYDLPDIRTQQEMRSKLLNVCVAVNSEDADGLARGVLRQIDTQFADEPNLQLEWKKLLFLALSLQYNQAEPPTEQQLENDPDYVPDPVFKTLCGQ